MVRDAAAEPLIAAPIVAHDLLETAATLDELAAYQDALSEALLRGRDPAAARTALLARSDTTAFHDQIARWNLRALEVAITLTMKWGEVAR